MGITCHTITPELSKPILENEKSESLNGTVKYGLQKHRVKFAILFPCCMLVPHVFLEYLVILYNGNASYW